MKTRVRKGRENDVAASQLEQKWRDVFERGLHNGGSWQRNQNQNGRLRQGPKGERTGGRGPGEEVLVDVC